MVNFKNINKVPTNLELIDIALNKTQRKTPTVIHPSYQISRIRAFYTRKIIYSSKEFTERLDTITSQFPRLESIHPFYSNLLNILYDRDHYKMALGHVSSTRSVIDKIAKEYVRLVKYAESLYRAKQLKRAALGKMATFAKKLGKSMGYLEEVRQNLSRLPTIDPSTRSLMLCGYPNVGKSSFINKISRAQVDVQPYAFTTKNLYVGHFDYNYLKWQVIDTPGILDHPIEERNTIEMQTITALAHIQSTVLFFIDISTACGYTIEEQIKLCKSLEPILGTFLICITKSDLLNINLENKLEDELEKLEFVDMEDRKLLIEFLNGRKYMVMSCQTEVNVENVKKVACEMLLDKRLGRKVNDEKMTEFINRINIIKPKNYNPRELPKFKDEVLVTEREKREAMGDDYVFDERENYFCGDKYDVVPEIYEGKNVADYISADILQRLDDLEKKEEEMDYDKKYDTFTKDEREYVETVHIRKKQREVISNEKGRCAVPARWIENRQKCDKPIIYQERNTNIAPYVIKKNAFKKVPNQRYYEEKPKHIYRGKSKHGSKGRK